MKTTKYIASFLYFAVLFSFIVSTVFFIIGLSAKFLGTDGQYIYKYDDNSWTTIGQKNSEGSLVPVRLILRIPDSIKINSKNSATFVEDSYPPINNMFLKENKKTQAINIYEVHSFGGQDYSVVYNDNDKNKSSFKFIKYEHYGDSQYLSIKSNDPFTDFILALRSPIIYLFHVLQMCFLALILKQLAKEIYFSKVLSKYISTLGYLLLFSQSIPIIYSFIDKNLFGNITVRTQIIESLQNAYFENIKVYFNPIIDVNIYIFFLGIVLVLFTKLVERGQALEEENELTI